MPELTHCPECGVPFTGKLPRDPAKHYHVHYPPFDNMPKDPTHYLSRKRATMLLQNDSYAEPPEGPPPPLRVAAAPVAEEEEEEF